MPVAGGVHMQRAQGKYRNEGGQVLGWVCASSTTLGTVPDKKRQQPVLTAFSA